LLLLRERAEQLRELRVVAVDGVALLLGLAEEVEKRAKDLRVLLAPSEAAAVSGYSRDQLRRLVRAGRLTNHGTLGKALYDSDELPRKASRRDSHLREARETTTVRRTREQIARAVITRHAGGE
jgi:hypothetical protein